MEISTKQILKILNVLSWIIFIGVSINAGGFIFNTIYTFFINSDNTHSFWGNLSLNPLYQYSSSHFLTVTSLMIIVAILKATMFYLIIKVLHDNKLNMSQPFSIEMGKFIFNLSYLTFGIGLFSYWGTKFIAWLVSMNIVMPDIESLGLGGSDVWLFMAVVLFVIAHIFKRGIEIQSENELTI